MEYLSRIAMTTHQIIQLQQNPRRSDEHVFPHVSQHEDKPLTITKHTPRKNPSLLIASAAFMLVMYAQQLPVQAFQTKINSPPHKLNFKSIFSTTNLPRQRWGTTTYSRRTSYTLPPLRVSNEDTSVTYSMNKETLSGNENITSLNTVSIVDERIYQTAITRTALAVAASCILGGSIYHWMGAEPAEEFFAGYLVEQSLSVDNLFVFLLLFDYFKVPLAYQNRVLNYGIIGAIVFRAIVIALGSAVLHTFKPVLLVFASILIFSSYSALSSLGDDDEDEKEDMGENAIVKFSKSLFPTTEMFEGENFFSSLDGGVRKATPLLLCLICVEISDIVFAIDSIPAVFGVTEVCTQFPAR